MRFVLPLVLCAAAFGQMRDNRDKEMTCQASSLYQQAHLCEIREQTIAAPARIAVSPGSNGGVNVKGWLRSDVLVRSRVDAWGRSGADLTQLLKQVSISATGGIIVPKGPDSAGDSNWSVSFEIFVPRTTNLGVSAHNGGVRISDVHGTIMVETGNGGIAFTRLAGDVSGSAHNGGIHAELIGSAWDGRQLDLRTHNGGVTVSMPAGYSAHIKAESGHGSLLSDFPVTVTGRIWPRTLDTNLGSGGNLIHISTSNGSIQLRRGA